MHSQMGFQLHQSHSLTVTGSAGTMFANFGIIARWLIANQ